MTMDAYDASNDVRRRGAVTMDPNQQNTLTAIGENYPSEQGKLKRIFGYINADFSTPEDAPSGTLSVYALDAAVHPESMPDEAFSQLLVCPVFTASAASPPLDDAYFTSKKDALSRAVPQFSNTPASLNFRAANNYDTHTWEAELGPDCGVAGIYKSVENHGRDVTYYAVVNAGSESISREVRGLVASEPELTFGDMLGDMRFTYARNAVTRNATRLAYKVARAMGVRISHGADSAAFTVHPEDDAYGYLAPPMAAETRGGGHLQANSTVARMLFGGERAAGVYHDTHPVDGRTRVCYVRSALSDGIARFTLDNNACTGYAFPSSTGVKTPAALLPDVSDAEAAAYATGFTWEGKTKTECHHDALNPAAYHTLDNAFLVGMRELGWEQSGTNGNQSRLIPVMVKISNPEHKRSAREQ